MPRTDPTLTHPAAAGQRFDPLTLTCPIVSAPMAGGPSTPALAAAVSTAGGLGFLAAGYKSVDAMQVEIDDVYGQLPAGLSFGVNLFAPSPHTTTNDEITAYRDRLVAEAQRRNVPLGVPRWDDDHYRDKLTQLSIQPVAVVSITFGCPTAADVDLLHVAGSAVWVTVTTANEAASAHAVGADALVVQGVEAGGHRGGFDDTHPGDIGLLALLQLVRATVGHQMPLIATGGLSTGESVAAVLTAGAAAAQLGTAFLLAPEAGTHSAHRALIEHQHRPTALTRAFTGRTARSISNRFLEQHSAQAPSAYPDVHHLTNPLRAAARSAGDTDALHLWAGQSYSLTRRAPAADIVRQLDAEAKQALQRTAQRWQQHQ